jgi:hypothetical protein
VHLGQPTRPPTLLSPPGREGDPRRLRSVAYDLSSTSAGSRRLKTLASLRTRAIL